MELGGEAIRDRNTTLAELAHGGVDAAPREQPVRDDGTHRQRERRTRCVGSAGVRAYPGCRAGILFCRDVLQFLGAYNVSIETSLLGASAVGDRQQLAVVGHRHTELGAAALVDVFRVDLDVHLAHRTRRHDQVVSLLESVMQDFGEIPPEYLVPAGDGGYVSSSEPGRSSKDVWQRSYHEEGAYLYYKWDYRRQHYRKNWCVLREIDVHPGDESFARRTLDRYTRPVVELRRTFEALRGGSTVAQQGDGDDIDLDAVFEAYADMRAGMEMSDRLITKPRKLERDMAVVFMVDMSGSIKGWSNDAERESLVLLCEALEILGDRYAIYGFSGITRKRCELYRVKSFDEGYAETVKRRIAGIRPQDYTRMGVVIRHLTRLLCGVEARTRLLVTLSDGKPDDYDGYRSEYGIEDTRQALIEAKHEGIHPCCITIDTEARDYLPIMCGPANYVLVDEVRKLPLKVSDIYRRLTSSSPDMVAEPLPVPGHSTIQRW